MDPIIKSLQEDSERRQNLLLTIAALQGAFSQQMMSHGAPSPHLCEVYTDGMDSLHALLIALGAPSARNVSDISGENP